MDRSNAFAVGDDTLAADTQLHGRLCDHVLVRPPLDEGAERFELEELLFPPDGLAHEQLERAVGRFEVISEVFQLLHAFEHLPRQVVVHLETQLCGLREDRRPPGLLGHEHPSVVPDQARVGVLVGVGSTCQCGRVETGLVGERRATDVGPVRVEVDVHDLGDVMADRREHPELVGGENGAVHLQDEVRQDRAQVGIAGALAVSVDASLHLTHARLDRRQ